MNFKDIKTTYAALKRQHGPKTLLLFRVNNQLEAYLDDATIVADKLGIKIEQTELGHPHPLLTVRIPVSEQELYINLLLDAGYGVHVQQEPDATNNY